MFADWHRLLGDIPVTSLQASSCRPGLVWEALWLPSATNAGRQVQEDALHAIAVYSNQQL